MIERTFSMMNMRSVPIEDATASARIRDAAIARFGAQGFARTSVREIAGDAGVSPALVIHHFGSKEALRQACDDWLATQLIGEKARAVAGPEVAATIREWLDDPERFRAYIDYFATMLADGTPAGNRLFDRLVHDTAAMLDAGVADGSVRDASDPEMRALIVTVHGLAPCSCAISWRARWAHRSRVRRRFGRMTRPMLELYTHGLYADSRMLDATDEALEAPFLDGEHAALRQGTRSARTRIPILRGTVDATPRDGAHALRHPSSLDDRKDQA